MHKTEAQKYVIPNQFTEVAERNGATDLNAQTGLDETHVLLVDAGESAGAVGVA